KIKVAPAVRLPAPEERAAADVVAAHPVEAFVLGVRVVDVVDEPMSRGGMGRVTRAGLFVLPRAIGGRLAVAPLEVPRLLERGGVVAMRHVAPALEQERAEPAFAKFLGGPAAADSRPDDNRI